MRISDLYLNHLADPIAINEEPLSCISYITQFAVIAHASYILGVGIFSPAHSGKPP
jgi:hypothetical protein